MIAPIPTPIPSKTMALTVEDGTEKYYLKDTQQYLSYWNTRMGWGFSNETVINYAEDLNNYLENTFEKDARDYYIIPNYSVLQYELKILIGLTNEQYDIFVTTNEEQDKTDRINYHSPYIPSDSSKVLTRAPANTQSAPFAHGKLYYAYIFVNFDSAIQHGPWTQTDINDALNDAYWGTLEIQDQAPDGANVVNDGGYWVATVEGYNTGDNSFAWDPDGWMDRALQELYVQDTNGDGWYTDDFARSLKQSTNSDSVMLIFFTHDNKGAYAVGPDKGYGDKAAVSYWGMYSDARDFPSVPNSYQHEALHLYGALDEYIVEGYTSPSQTYQLKSILSVSPMSEMYENRNHELSPDGHVHGIMCGEMYSYNNIQQCARNFIGWGDFDNDGTLDPIDPRPYG